METAGQTPRIHHVAFEVELGRIAAESEFWLAAGFPEVEPPAALGESFRWFENGGTQIHLMPVEEPASPPARGHVAIVAPDLDRAIHRIGELGCEVKESRQLWGARRFKATTPTGHTVELMAAPPKPDSGTRT